MGRNLWGYFAAAATLALVIGCGSSSPTAPSNNGGGGGTTGPGPVGATITISASGQVSPTTVTIGVGQSVMFVNNDSKAHDMESDPHPAHTDCPSLRMGSIGAGQSRTSNALTVARSCGYHDHNDPSNNALKGTVVVQ